MAQCSVDECDKPVFSRGWCSKHYARWRSHGDPMKIIQNQKHGLSLRDRFLSYVPLADADRCWEWTGSRNKAGYGQLNIEDARGGRTMVLAHRLSWTLFRGNFDAECVLHRCDNPPCVNPAHLFLGDKTDNAADKMRKKRHRFGVSRGSKHGCALLTEDQVLAIRASTGPSHIVGEKYGVSGRTIRQIRTRETWTHLP